MWQCPHIDTVSSITVLPKYCSSNNASPEESGTGGEWYRRKAVPEESSTRWERDQMRAVLEESGTGEYQRRALAEERGIGGERYWRRAGSPPVHSPPVPLLSITTLLRYCSPQVKGESRKMSWLWQTAASERSRNSK